MAILLRMLRPKFWIVCLVVLLALLFSLPKPVTASEIAQAGSGGLGVDGALLVLEAQPGQTYTHTMVVSNGAGGPVLDIQVDAAGFGETITGSFEPLPAETDLSPYSARSFITQISSPQFRLEPGQSMSVDATLQIPADFSKDTRYAIIYIHSSPVDSGDDNGVGQILAVSVPVIITPPDVLMDTTGVIENLQVNPVENGKPIEVLTKIKNTGNRHFKIQGMVKINDPAGNLVTELTIPLTGTSIFPTFSREVEVSYNAQERAGGLEPGNYTAQVSIVREDGTLVEEKRVPFEIKERYNPFPDIDENDLLIVSFDNEEPGTIDAIDTAGIEIRFEGTGPVTGSVAIGRYRQEPAVTPAFDADRGDGGTGSTAVRYVAVKVAGFDQGTAHFSFHYQPNELGNLDPNSLYLANHMGDFWQKLQNLSVQTGSEVVLGDMTVFNLTDGALIALGAGGSGGENALLALLRENLDIVIVAGFAVLLVVAILGVLLISRGRSAKAKK